jgi:hypothetical protein
MKMSILIAKSFFETIDDAGVEIDYDVLPHLLHSSVRSSLPAPSSSESCNSLKNVFGDIHANVAMDFLIKRSTFVKKIIIINKIPGNTA